MFDDSSAAAGTWRVTPKLRRNVHHISHETGYALMKAMTQTPPTSLFFRASRNQFGWLWRPENDRQNLQLDLLMSLCCSLRALHWLTPQNALCKRCTEIQSSKHCCTTSESSITTRWLKWSIQIVVLRTECSHLPNGNHTQHNKNGIARAVGAAHADDAVGLLGHDLPWLLHCTLNKKSKRKNKTENRAIITELSTIHNSLGTGEQKKKKKKKKENTSTGDTKTQTQALKRDTGGESRATRRIWTKCTAHEKGLTCAEKIGTQIILVTEHICTGTQNWTEQRHWTVI